LTATRKALLLPIDYNIGHLLTRVDLGYVSDVVQLESLTQMAYTETDDQQLFITIAHKAIGLIAIRLRTFRKISISVI
jgi:hypothetical protein